jgi:putative OmpL-like beta-barrel porin-2
MRLSRAFFFATATIAAMLPASNNVNAETPLGRTYQDLYPTNQLTVPGGHFFNLVGYENVQAPDNFFYSHSLTMFNSEPFTHTGFLGNGVGVSGQFYGGRTLGWDTGFPDSKSSTAALGGSGSISFPVYDGGTWAGRVQLNIALSGVENPFPNNGIEPYVGATVQVYSQSISGNAIGIGTGIASESNQLDAHLFDAFAMLNFNHWTSRSRASVGEIDFGFGQTEDFYTLGSDSRFFIFGDMFSIDLLNEYGRVKDERTVRYIGANFDFAPDIQQPHTFFANVGHVDIDFDNPFARDRDYWFAKFGIRLDLNSAQNQTSNPLTLRARQVLNTPWSSSVPYMLTYGL